MSLLKMVNKLTQMVITDIGVDVVDIFDSDSETDTREEERERGSGTGDDRFGRGLLGVIA